MPSRAFILGVGLALLLIVSAASIGLDVKSRSDTASVEHTLEVLQKIADLRLLIRRAESAARGFGTTSDPALITEFHDSVEATGPAFAELIEATRDNPGPARLLEDTKALVARRLAVSGELLALRQAGDTAAVAERIAKAEGRTAMRSIDTNFEEAIAGERKLLEERSQRSGSTGRILLAIDLAGIALILILATVLIRATGRSSRELLNMLSLTRASNEQLEAAVAERTEHLVAAHEELRHSSSVLQSTFRSMAEAVLVIDTKGDVLLSNQAAEKMLRYRPGTKVTKLRALS